MKGFQFGKKLKFGKLRTLTSGDASRWKKEGIREFKMGKKGKLSY